MTGFDVGSKHVGDGSPCLIVAEVAQAHEGSLQIAHAYIDAIADAGADAVKFQCHIAEAESTPGEAWRIEPKYPQDVNRYAYWRRMEFRDDAWAGLAQHCRERGMEFLCTPFSLAAVEMLDKHVPAWKVASGEVENDRLMSAIDDTCKPVLLSTGMSTTRETRSGWIKDFEGSGVALLQCTSEYPCKPEHVGLNMLAEMRKWCHYGDSFPLPVGLSDHSGTIYAGLAAVALGCDVLEVHVKLSEYDQGFDASSSITIPKLRELVEGVRFIEKAKQPVDKDALAKELEPMRRLFMDKHRRKQAVNAGF
jgi:N-acetylneuraminate synthase